ncbi:hypothetical protein ACGFYM_36125 [Streptomyces sp. NPDC048231]|uniref:hypothetical protein n=1 Tax=Streptomyces sp. NPDC048231 TaxID=3365519 RepID=UPI003721BFBC
MPRTSLNDAHQAPDDPRARRGTHGPGRRAALPPPDYRRASNLDETGLIVHAVGENGEDFGTYDFTVSSGPEEMRRELVAALARVGRRRWNSRATYRSQAKRLRQFLRDAVVHDPPVTSVEEITPFFWKKWSESSPNRQSFAPILKATDSLPPETRALLERVQHGHKRDRASKVAYSREEFRIIRDAATRTVRAARLRIDAHVELLERWRSGQLELDDDPEWGEVLDHLDRTGDVPRFPSGVYRHLHLFGDEGYLGAVSRLFPTMAETGAAAVLLICHEGWNLSVLRNMAIPQDWPNADSDEESPAVYRVETDKPRRGRRRHGSNNLVNAGEGTPGWAMRQVLAMTEQARRSLHRQGRPTNMLLLANRVRAGGCGRGRPRLYDFKGPEEQLRWAIISWREMTIEAGTAVPADLSSRRLRHTAQVHYGGPRNNTQATQESDYLLRDATVREESRSVVEAGLADAVVQAHAQVRMRMAGDVTGDAVFDAERIAKEAGLDLETARQLIAGDLKTPAGSCTDFDHPPLPASGPCVASFLLCFACPNSIATSADLPRIVYLRQAIASLNSIVSAAVWEADWAGHAARINDFLTSHTDPAAWPHLLSRLTDQDKQLIDRTLSRRLDV